VVFCSTEKWGYNCAYVTLLDKMESRMRDFFIVLRVILIG